MTKVMEVTAYQTEHDGTHDEVVSKLVAMGWEVVEQKNGRTALTHDLIPGSQRVVMES